MRLAEAAKLKPGDLIVIDKSRSKHYGGWVFEIENINPEHDNWCYRITLKQPGFDGGFRLTDYDTRLVHRYEKEG